jgi:Ca-activated chloride channel homolog
MTNNKFNIKMKVLPQLGLLAVLLLASLATFAQKERKFIREGNKFYEKAMADTTKTDSVSYQKAEVAYRKALDIKPSDYKAQYNVANSLFKQNKMADSQSQYEQALNAATTKEDRAKVFFNIGNTLLGQQKFDESIEAYKNALRNDPTDVEAKYNLEFARRMKQQQEQQQQNQDQNQDNQDQDEDQNKDQNQDQDQQKQNQGQPKQQNKISQQSAEQMLKALENDEKQTQEKVNKAKAVQVQPIRTDKDW